MGSNLSTSQHQAAPPAHPALLARVVKHFCFYRDLISVSSKGLPLCFISSDVVFHTKTMTVSLTLAILAFSKRLWLGGGGGGRSEFLWRVRSDLTRPLFKERVTSDQRRLKNRLRGPMSYQYQYKGFKQNSGIPFFQKQQYKLVKNIQVSSQGAVS